MSEHNDNLYFLTEEVTALRGEIVFFLKQIEENEKLAIFGSGAIWSLVVSIKWNDALNVIIWIPSIITIILFLKRKMIVKTIKKISSYIKSCEKIISDKSGIAIGWESYNKKLNEENSLGKKYMKWWATLFWLILFSANTLLAIFFPFKEMLIK